jgi:hypothetical protein
LACAIENFDNKTAFFLLNHPKLASKLTDSTDMMTIPNTIKITDTKSGQNFQFMFGWIEIATGVNTALKIHCNNNVFSAYYINANGAETNTASGFNVYYCLN